MSLDLFCSIAMPAPKIYSMGASPKNMLCMALTSLVNQTAFSAGAYTASDKALRGKSCLVHETRHSHSYVVYSLHPRLMEIFSMVRSGQATSYICFFDARSASKI